MNGSLTFLLNLFFKKIIEAVKSEVQQLYKTYSGKMSTFGQVKQFANFKCQLKTYESMHFGRTCFIINVHVVKDWKITFIISE